MDYLEMHELYHHGIKGQKWGVRRYQNEDGSLTSEGRSRYGVDESGNMSKEGKKQLRKDIAKDRWESTSAAKSGFKAAAITWTAAAMARLGSRTVASIAGKAGNKNIQVGANLVNKWLKQNTLKVTLGAGTAVGSGVAVAKKMEKLGNRMGKIANS